MKLSIVFGQVSATTVAGTLLLFCSGLAGCSSNETTAGDTTAGQGGVNGGGHSSSGGNSSSGATGGSNSSKGGNTNTGGSSNGGSNRSATGGNPSTGGALPTGGTPATGGAPSATGGNGTAGSSSTSVGFDPCPATGNCKVLPLGDSITAGAGAQPGDNGGYRVELFTKALANSKHITFVGSQTSGPTTVGGQTFPRKSRGAYRLDDYSNQRHRND